MTEESLTKTELNRMRAAFEIFDVNGDGTITSTVIKNMSFNARIYFV